MHSDSTTPTPQTQQLSRRNLSDQLTTAAAAFGYFATLTCSTSEGKQATSEHPKKLCEVVARSLAARGVNNLVAHAFAPANLYGVEVLHFHAFTDKPPPTDYARAWSSEHGPASADCRPMNDSPSTPSRIARYVAQQANGFAAGWKDKGGRVRTRSATLEDATELVKPAIEPVGIEQPLVPVALIADPAPIAPIASPIADPAIADQARVRLMAAILSGCVLDTIDALKAEGIARDDYFQWYEDAKNATVLSHAPT